MEDIQSPLYLLLATCVVGYFMKWMSDPVWTSVSLKCAGVDHILSPTAAPLDPDCRRTVCPYPVLYLGV